jgi:hypothetical protein
MEIRVREIRVVEIRVVEIVLVGEVRNYGAR